MLSASVPHAVTPFTPTSCVPAMSTDDACSQDVSCSQQTQAAIATSAIGTQCALTLLISGSSQTELELPVEVDDTQAGAPLQRHRASRRVADLTGKCGKRTCSCHPHPGNKRKHYKDSSKHTKYNIIDAKKPCVAMSPDAACSQNVSCSHYTQTAIATRAIGTQCGLTSLISASSQTGPEFSVRVVNTQVADSSASEKFSTSQGGADISAEPNLHTCSCNQHSGNTRSFFGDSEKVQLGGKLHSCLSCQQRNHLPNQVKVSGSKMCYACTVCKKVFYKKSALDIHMRMHTGERPYVCSTCQKSYCRKNNLITHQRLHSGERPYVCSTCQRSFTQKDTLVQHERLHSGELPFVCSICQKSFTHKTSLVQHRRLHSGERPYVCSTCQKSFIQKNHLVNHERLHSGERPFVCSTCQKSFGRKDVLVRHERSHSGIKPCVWHLS